jgi:hypothetical protein
MKYLILALFVLFSCTTQIEEITETEEEIIEEIIIEELENIILYNAKTTNFTQCIINDLLDGQNNVSIEFTISDPITYTYFIYIEDQNGILDSVYIDAGLGEININKILDCTNSTYVIFWCNPGLNPNYNGEEYSIKIVWIR